MSQVPPKPPEDIFTDEASCDLSRAAYAPQLSLVTLDPSTDVFVATIDKVLFRRPVDVVTTILSAHGFIINLENILACLDQFHIGVRTKPVTRRHENEPPVVREYMPCVQISLPDKNKVGDLLKRFYDEIAGYEMALARLQQAEGSQVETKRNEAAELRAEIARLRQENERLKEQAAMQRSRLRELEQVEARMHRVLEEQNHLPDNVRLGVVKAVHVAERAVEVKAGRVKLNVPMALLGAIPRPGSTALVALRQGQVTGALFYDGEDMPFEETTGVVVATALHVIKVRDRSRRLWTLRANHRGEEQMFARLKRQDSILLSLYEGKAIKVRPLSDEMPDVHADRVQESVAKAQLRGLRLDQTLGQDKGQGPGRKGAA